MSHFGEGSGLFLLFKLSLFKAWRASTLRPRSLVNLDTHKREKKSIKLTELPSWRGFQRHHLVCGVFCSGPRSWPEELINFWKPGQGLLSGRCHPATGAAGSAGRWSSSEGHSWCGWRPDAWGRKQAGMRKRAKSRSRWVWQEAPQCAD